MTGQARNRFQRSRAVAPAPDVGVFEGSALFKVPPYAADGLLPREQMAELWAWELQVFEASGLGPGNAAACTVVADASSSRRRACARRPAFGAVR